MSNVRSYTDGPYRMLELTEARSGTVVTICPERGGIVTGFAPHGEELFYMDRETFLDPAANIRGGNPILFPVSGQLKDGAYELDGKRYAMKNHGLARTSAWSVTATGVTEEGEPFAKLSLASTEEMLESFPFAFELVFTYLIRRGTLVILQEYRNRSDRRMPMYPGFHPYFATETTKLLYTTDAAHYLDYNDGVTKPFDEKLDIGRMKESAALLDAKEPKISFLLPWDGRTVTMEYSEAFRYVVLWTVAGKDFVCVEPWMALNGELNRGEDLVWVEPGETMEAWLTIRAAKE